MEMFSNIWNALSTENVQFSVAMGYPLIIVESLFGLLLFINLLNIKCTNKQKLLYVTAVSLGRYYK